MITLHKTVVLAAGLMAGALFAQSAALGQSSAAGNGLPNRIVGLWDIDVSLALCANENPVGGFRAMHKFELGGTGQVVPATNPVGLSAHMLIWEYVGGNDFHWFARFFRFENGEAVAYTVIESVVTLSGDGSEYSGSGVATTYDMDDNFLNAAICPSFSGTRFTGNE